MPEEKELEGENVKYIRIPVQQSPGEKRNIAVKQASGDILAICDDDDWFGPGRLAAQAAHLIKLNLEVSMLEQDLALWVPEGDFCSFIDPELRRNIWVLDSTMMFTRDAWVKRGPFADAWTFENREFIRSVAAEPGRLEVLENKGLFVYVRHPKSSVPWDRNARGYFKRVKMPDWFPVETLAQYTVAAKEGAA